ANGAGKSTLIKILARVYKQDRGDIILNGENINWADTTNIRKLGIDFIFQELELIPGFSVAQNILFGSEPLRCGIIDWKEMGIQAQEVLDKLAPGAIDVNCLVRELTIAQQQLVCIARALNNTPKVLVLDEPTSRLSAEETDVLLSLLKKLKEERDITVIYISHRMEELFRFAARVTVLRDGEKVGTFKVDETTPQEVIKHMIGREVLVENQRRMPRKIQRKKPVIAVKDLAINGLFGPISFEVYQGEIFGITGVVGSKKTELLEAIFGRRKLTGGEIYLDGERRLLSGPLAAKNCGLSLVPEDRRKDGLILDFSVRENISLPTLKKWAWGKFMIKRAEEKQVAKEISQEFTIKTSSIETHARFLSGGNQQKVVLGKWLLGNSELYFFDEPTIGIDVGAKEEIYKLIRDLADEGKTVIVASSDVDEVIGLADRILVLFEGKVQGLLEAEEVNREDILYLAMGGQKDAAFS
ncbi:MAG: sugar ABC transporter ATP-binding protein, partial [Firmicutes bacterium]|nr:sugar ABC transporter ATP-binding protein [Bacillota bacterium]